MRLVSRHVWVVVLALLAVSARLHAGALSELLAVPLMVPPSPVFEPAAVHVSPERSRIDALLDRNPFDHVTGSLREPSRGARDPDPGATPPCHDVKVLAIVASDEADWSFATFAGERPLLRRRGGEVGGFKVLHVAADRVWLDRAGSSCQAALFDRSASPPPPAAPLPDGVRRTGPTSFDIDRATLERLLENQARLMREGRVAPEIENGKVVGLRLAGLRPEAALTAFGFENGDRLETINGFEIAQPEQALEAYARLRGAPSLTVQLVRRGRRMNLDYAIR